MINTTEEQLKKAERFIAALNSDLADSRHSYKEAIKASQKTYASSVEYYEVNFTDETHSRFNSAMRTLHSTLDKFSNLLLALLPNLETGHKEGWGYWKDLKIKKDEYPKLCVPFHRIKGSTNYSYLCDYVNYVKHEDNIGMRSIKTIIVPEGFPKKVGMKVSLGNEGSRGGYSLSMKSKNSEEFKDGVIEGTTPLIEKFTVKKKSKNKVHKERNLSDFKIIYNLLIR